MHCGAALHFRRRAAEVLYTLLKFHTRCSASRTVCWVLAAAAAAATLQQPLYQAALQMVDSVTYVQQMLLSNKCTSDVQVCF